MGQEYLDPAVFETNIHPSAFVSLSRCGALLVSVGREDDVKFAGLCEARGIPVLRICVTDGRNADAHLEIQGVASWSLTESASAYEGTLPELFG
jgi:phosphoribosylformylglycinamidine synthase